MSRLASQINLRPQPWLAQVLLVLVVAPAVFLLLWVQSYLPPWLVWVAVLVAAGTLWLLAEDFRHFALLYVPALLLSPSFFRALEVVSRGLRLDHVILVVAAVLLVCRSLLQGRLRLPRVLTMLFLAYLASSFSTLLVGAVAQGRSFPSLASLVAWQGLARPLLVFVAFSLILRSERQVRFTVWIIVITGAALTLMGLLQFARVDWVVELTARYFDRKEGPVVLGDRGAVVGTFDGLHNTFAMFFLIYVPLVLSLLAAGGRRMSPLLSAGLWSLAGLSFIPLLGTFSRAGALGMVAALLTFAVLRQRLRRGQPRSLAPAVAGLAVLAFVFLAILAMEEVTGSARIRYVNELLVPSFVLADPRVTYTAPLLWQTFLNNPILGVGSNIGTAGDIAYLAELAKGGMIGFVLFYSMVAYVMYVAMQVLRMSPPGTYRALAGAVLVINVALLAASLGNQPLASSRVVELYWVLVACLMFARREVATAANRTSSPSQRGSLLHEKPPQVASG